MTCNLFVQSYCLKYPYLKILSVAENVFFVQFSVTLVSIIIRIKSLNKIIVDGSDRNVQMNG